MNESLVNAEIVTVVAELTGGAKISRAELARRSGVSLSTLNRMWKGDYEVGLGNLVAIAGALNTTAADIMATALDRVGAERAIEDVRARLSGEVSDGTAKIASLEEARGRKDAVLPSAEEVEQMLADDTKRIAANRDPEADTDEDPSP